MGKEKGAVVWTDGLSTGVKVVDLQHREFIRLVNDLLNKSARGVSKKAILEAFRFLRLYVIEHLGTEEMLMDEYRYSDAAAHKAEHAHYRGKLSALLTRLSRGGVTEDLQRKLNYLLVEWFTNHIQEVDQKFCAFLRTEARENRSLFTKLRDLARDVLSSQKATS